MDKFTIENVEFPPTPIFCKFNPRDRLEALRDRGYLYLKNINYYIEEEKETLIKGKGDIDEAVMFKSSKVKIFLPDTDIQIGEAKSGVAVNQLVLRQPIYCMTYKNITENIVAFDYPTFQASVSFDDRLKEFGEYVLVIHDVGEFLKRVKEKLNKLGISFQHGVVKYRDTDHLYFDNNQVEMNTAFNKNPFFDYQSEFRILLNNEVEDHYTFEIGSVKDISVLLETERLIAGMKCRGKISEIIEKS